MATKKKSPPVAEPKSRTRRQMVAESAPSSPPYSPLNYVPITSTAFNITQLNWHKQATIMAKLLANTGIAKRLHSVIRNFVIGEGIDKSIKAQDDKLKPYEQSCMEAMERFWNDPRNRVDEQVHDWVFEHSSFGEKCIPVITDDVDGTVVLQNLPVTWISDVETNPLDINDAVRFSTSRGEWRSNKRSKDGGKMNWTGTTQWLKVIRYNSERYLYDPKTGECQMESIDDTGVQVKKQNPEFGKLTGQAFLFRSNNILGNPRGQGDSFSVMDLLQALDQFLFDSMNRLDMQSAVVWDLTVDGKPDEVKKWQNQPLPVGSNMFAHNKKLVLEAKAPAIKVEEFVEFIRILREIIAGNVGIPTYAMGYGGDTNVATAKEQAPVMHAEFNNRRTWWENKLKFIVQYVLECANSAGMLYDSETKETITLTPGQLKKMEVSISFKPFERSNTDNLAETLSKVGDALLVMEQGGYFSHETCMKIARQVGSMFGIDTSEDQENSDIPAVLPGVGGQPVDSTAISKALAESAESGVLNLLPDKGERLRQYSKRKRKKVST